MPGHWECVPGRFGEHRGTPRNPVKRGAENYPRAITLKMAWVLVILISAANLKTKGRHSSSNSKRATFSCYFCLYFVCLLLNVMLENISLVWRRHHRRRRVTKNWPILDTYDFWAERDLYRAKPSVTRGLSYSGVIRKTSHFHCLLRQILRTYFYPVPYGIVLLNSVTRILHIAVYIISTR